MFAMPLGAVFGPRRLFFHSAMTSLRLPFTPALCATLLLLAACSSTPLQTTAPVAGAPATGPLPAVAATRVAPPVATAGLAPAPAPAVNALPPHLDAANPISQQRSVFFDYDDDSILPQWQGLIERQGRYLAGNPALHVRVEGNTDERGGREYNLALGQRRADAVRRALLISGARPAQLEAVSLGEERPRAEAHDEPAWQQNRRADLAYQATH